MILILSGEVEKNPGPTRREDFMQILQLDMKQHIPDITNFFVTGMMGIV